MERIPTLSGVVIRGKVMKSTGYGSMAGVKVFDSLSVFLTAELAVLAGVEWL
jgi:hypothetical protein